MPKKPSWLYNQSGVIPYRLNDGVIEVLLVTSVRRGRWIIPKGVVERQMTPAASALKEAWEEAGVSGEVSDEAIGSFEVRKWGGTCTVAVFLLEVRSEKDDWPERKVRRRRWVPIQKAAKIVEESALKDLIRRASRILGHNGG